MSKEKSSNGVWVFASVVVIAAVVLILTGHTEVIFAILVCLFVLFMAGML